MDDLSAQVHGVGALADPARWTLYCYVVGQEEPVSRDQAAAGVGIPRHTARFHLDKLLAEGLLSTESRRLSGRRGPGAGRPAKLYLRSDRQIAVTLPPRHYDLAAEILADAVEDADDSGGGVSEAVRRAAAEAGRRLAAEHVARAADTGAAPLERLAEALTGHGYEPRSEEDALVLANCPFHALAQRHTALVCGMNLHLIAAVIDELGQAGVRATLAPAPDRCCVRVTAASA